MATYVTTIKTELSAADAFAYATDFRNLSEWDPGVSSSAMVDGDEPGVGTSYDVMAGVIKLRYRTLEHEVPHKSVLEATTSFLRSFDVLTVKETPSGSELTYDATLELLGIGALANPVVGLFFDRIGDKAAAGLAEALNGTIK